MKTLSEVLDGLPKDRRERIEQRSKGLIADEVERLRGQVAALDKARIDRQWLSAEFRWGEWNGNEFQCVDASAANEMLAEIERLRNALKTVGDDYPGSSCQQWCYEQAGIPLSESPTVGQVMQSIRAERAAVQPSEPCFHSFDNGGTCKLCGWPFESTADPTKDAP